MGFANGKGIFRYSLFSLVLCLWLCGNNGIDDFEIFRSKHDIFTNLKCKDESGLKCNDEQCNLYNANCVGESNCKYCICSRENKTTFISITTEDDTSNGVCNSGDEDILPGCYRFSDGSFVAYLELGETGPKQTKINISSPSFTKNGKCQIQKTFEFFQNGEEWKTHTGTPFLLKEIRTNTIELEINSAEDFDFWNGSLLKVTIACEGNRGMTGNEERCALFKVETLPRYDEIVIPVARVAIRKDNDNKLMNFEIWGFGKNLASKGRDNTRAAGVGRRSRSTTRPPTTRSTTRRSTTRSTTRRSTTRRPITRSTTRPHTTRSTTRRSTTRRPTTRRPTTRSTTRRPTTRRSTTRPPTIRSTTQPRGPTRAVRTTLTSQSPTPTISTTENSQESQKDKTSKSAGKNSIATAVTVTLLLVALALALGYLVYHRRRKRAQVPQNNYNDLGVINHSKDIYEDPDRRYETLKEDRNEASLNQPGISSDTYSYPDSNIFPNPTSSEQEYTYAKDTDFHKSSGSTQATSEKPISNGVVHQTLEQPGQPTVDDFYNYPDNTNTAKPSVSSYHLPRGNPNTKVATQYPANRAVYHTYTLEQPEKPSDDDFYHYPDNTNITKTPSPELEYSYAKDTDFPRGNPDTMVATRDPANRAVHHTLKHESPTTDVYKSSSTKIPTDLEYTYAKDTEIPKSFVNAPAAGDALYHTPEQEEPAPTEPAEYSYVKNSDMPSIQLRTKQTTNGHSPVPDNSGLRHTLQEPNPPQAPVYPTLEGRADVGNYKQVTDERPNFSDHTYIDVIEDSNKTDLPKC
ncbi:Hypothetical predicted protein [Paramuricea clavata]|uniref:Uncharacterized protein n=1 Tax=Paramuricea clavata TaxID=317549 RepID=A0A7D9E1R1_PARCT|nr:Hypothetical predicted protein [Paramuricea clavata]